jgi:hypothetical protein
VRCRLKPFHLGNFYRVWVEDIKISSWDSLFEFIEGPGSFPRGDQVVRWYDYSPLD